MNQTIRLMNDHSKCDKCHEERAMGLHRVLWRGDSES